MVATFMAGERDELNEDVLAEAQELVEAMARDLLQLDREERQGEADPELLSSLFRGAHTLKGLAGVFGFARIGRLAHVLEDLLDAVRLGRVASGGAALEALFDGVEAFEQLLAEVKQPSTPSRFALEDFAARVRTLLAGAAAAAVQLADYELDPALLAALTEYEEHRLRIQVERGHGLFRLRSSVPLDQVESHLQALKERVASHAEIVSLLPGAETPTNDTIGLELLLGSALSLSALSDALGEAGTMLVAVPRRPRRAKVEVTPAAEPAARPASSALVAPRPASALARRPSSSVVRVDIRKLDHLMNAVGELAVLRGRFAQLLEGLHGAGVRRELLSEAHRVQRGFDRRLAELRDSVLDVRMVPLSQLFDKLGLVVRQIAREQDKQVQLVVRGADTEVDKLVAEEIADPLVHIVRNALDHGIETRAERVARGKPELATIEVRAQTRGSHVVVEVHDDGRGIDPVAVRHAAAARGLLRDAGGEPSRDELLDVLFVTGFSTSAEISDVSGRGIGLDVVRTNVQRLGGAVDVQSELGQGSTFAITLPITLAMISALVFSVRGRTMALPLAAVQEVVKLDPHAVRTHERGELLDLRGASVPLCRLGDLFRWPANESGATEQHVVVLASTSRRLGLAVDRMLGQQAVVIKPLGPSLRAARGIAGATDLGDQRLSLVVDAVAVVEEVLVPRAARLGVGGAA